jgi:hypothetical protein
MSDLGRRQFLKSLLGTVVQGAGAVVLAGASVRAARAAAAAPDTTDLPQDDLLKRADQLAMNWTRAEANSESMTAAEANGFLNVGWNPGFRNGGWPNHGWRNGGWFNGGWPNGSWRNGGWRNGGWSNGAWRNGGWLNGSRSR